MDLEGGERGSDEKDATQFTHQNPTVKSVNKTTFTTEITSGTGSGSGIAIKDNVCRKHRNVSEILDGLKSLSVRMLSSFSLGFRLLFVSIPFAFYAAGPIALIISSGIILIFLINIDHVEKSTYSFMAGFSEPRMEGR